MAKTAQQAYDGISAYIKKQSASYSSWYCGITENIESRLFGDHRAPKEGPWAYDECESSGAARNVEKALLKLGCGGGPGGGDDDAVYVYAYLKTSVTDP